jgi:hypothetical protein
VGGFERSRALVEIRGHRRHQRIGRARIAGALPSRHEDRLLAEQPSHPSNRSDRPFVGLGLPAPEAELATRIAAHLARREPEHHHAGGDPTGLVHPTLQLPADPFDHRRHGQAERAVPRTFTALAVIGLGLDDEPGRHQPAGAHLVLELLGELLGHEDQRLDVVDRIVEHPDRHQLGWRRLGAGWAGIAAGGKGVGIRTNRPEAGEEIGDREGGHGAEVVQTEPVEQVDDLGGDTAHLVEGAHADRRQERSGGRGTGRNHEGPAPGPAPVRGDARGEPAVGDADRHTITGDHGTGGRRAEEPPDELADPLGQPVVTTEVPGRTASGEGEEPGLGDLEHGDELGHGAGHRLEPPSVALGVVVDDEQVGAAGLCLASTQPGTDPDRARR